MHNANAQQAAFWEDLAPDWIAALEYSEVVSAPFGASAMQRLSLVDGLRVLDIGCGDGSTTIEISREVGESGMAVGIDIAPAMVAEANKTATAAAALNTMFRVADAQVEEFEAASFDAIYSKFGVMFFADPTAAFVNIRRALRPDGRLAFACWENIFANEWMFVPGSAVVSVTGSMPPMPGPGEPGPFSLSDPDHVAMLLEEAGFGDVEITPQAETVVLVESHIEPLVSLTRRVGPVREALLISDEETAARIDVAVRAAILDRAVDGVISLAAAALIVSAR